MPYLYGNIIALNSYEIHYKLLCPDEAEAHCNRQGFLYRRSKWGKGCSTGVTVGPDQSVIFILAVKVGIDMMRQIQPFILALRQISG